MNNSFPLVMTPKNYPPKLVRRYIRGHMSYEGCYEGEVIALGARVLGFGFSRHVFAQHVPPTPVNDTV